MSLIKQKTLLLLASIFLFSGCSDKLPSFNNSKETNKIINAAQLAKGIKSDPPITIVHVDKFVYKSMNINHRIKKIPMNVRIKRGMSLQDVVLKLPLPIVLEPAIKGKSVEYSGKLPDTLFKTMELLSALADIHWSYDNNIIRMFRTTPVTYSFPFYRSEINKLVANKLVSDTTDVFTEIQNGLLVALDNVSYTGELSEEYTSGSSSSSDNSLSNAKQDNSNKANDKFSFDSKNNSKSKTFSDSNTNSESVNNNSGSSSNISVSNKKGKKGTPVVSRKNNSSTKNRANKKGNKRNAENNNNAFNSGTGKSNYENSSISNSNNKNTTNSSRNSLAHSESAVFRSTYGSTSARISFSKKTSTIFARLAPSEERKISKILKRIVKEHFSNLIVVDTYVLEVSEDIASTLSTDVSSIMSLATKSVLLNNTNNLSREGFININNGNVDMASNTMLNMVKILVGNNKAKVMSNPRLVSLPNILVSVRDTTKYNYLSESTTVSEGVATTTAKLSTVSGGITLSSMGSVLNDNTIMISLAADINQFMGNEILVASNGSKILAPKIAPKALNTSLRVKAGDIIVLGGVKSSIKTKTSSFFTFGNSDEKVERNANLVILAEVKLIKFVENGVENELRSFISKKTKHTNSAIINIPTEQFKDFR
jgi:type II secretory pathway component GspD/PulD (secretin)